MNPNILRVNIPALSIENDDMGVSFSLKISGLEFTKSNIIYDTSLILND